MKYLDALLAREAGRPSPAEGPAGARRGPTDKTDKSPVPAIAAPFVGFVGTPVGGNPPENAAGRPVDFTAPDCPAWVDDDSLTFRPSALRDAIAEKTRMGG